MDNRKYDTAFFVADALVASTVSGALQALIQ